mmetsp:Transcript_28272/g.110998  ORF Transcript_28272/g.110998 Transcript_28272/m.110998 type:complete len:131 (-) Transcript_28272:69-461(-)|eukprot:CAMPEP_0113966316 /NCGR_PEP_ID=MMETSP0011_2-20120614/8265_1 /TAXON_ID=101924 /ORGANISM="Rhodosorus marinus" /LENGTH=130 /DNA_ID=CAMNT_0000978991 /DNA_START=229 /DNA_END=621 /DNA_ORIENTATION=- /assembly_acc=CAM_ASM_000156
MSFGASCRLDLPGKADTERGFPFRHFGGAREGCLGGGSTEESTSSGNSATVDSPPVSPTYLRKLEDNVRERVSHVDHPKFRLGARRKRRNLQKHVSFSSEVTIAEPDSLPVNVTYEEEGKDPHPTGKNVE